ncbi:MAG: hypothetical protein ACKN9T_18540 [Candidatus Methylumidiphilus sp.]
MGFDAVGAAAALAVMLACTALGSVVGAGDKNRLAAADAVVGLGLAGDILTLLAVATRAPVSLWAGLLGAAGLAALAWSASRRRLAGGAGFAAALLLASPLLVFAALGPATLWDDFAQWLPNAAYVFQHDSLPRPDLPATPSFHLGYPYILPFIVAGASWLAGDFLESAGAVANVVLLAAVAAAIAETPAADGQPGTASRWATTAAAIAAFFLFFPELPRNVLFSAYADTATIAAVGVLGLLGTALLQRLAENADARPLAWRFGLAAAALVNLKQANLVLLALLGLGLSLAAWRGGRLRGTPWPRLLPAIALPAAAVYLVWRHYLKHNLPGGELAFQPLAHWNWSAIPAMAQSLGQEWARNPGFHLLMWAVTLAGLASLRRPRHPDAVLAVATACVWTGYNAFLIVVYLGVMTAEEAGNAADYWRYTPHAGMLAVAAALLWLRRLPWPAPALRQSRPALLGLAALLPLALLITGPGRLSARAKPWPMHFRAVGQAVAETLPPHARLAVSITFNFDPAENAIDYDLRRYGRDAVTAALGIPAVAHASALFAWTGTGFRQVSVWPFPRAYWVPQPTGPQ